MAKDLSLADSEIIDQVKAYFYNANSFETIKQQVDQSTNKYSTKEKARLMSSAVFQLEHEQALRRRYVVESILGSAVKIEIEDQEIIVRYLAKKPNSTSQEINDLISKIKIIDTQGIETKLPASSQVIQEAVAYDRATGFIEEYYAEILAQEKITNIYGPIKSLPEQELSPIIDHIKSFYFQILSQPIEDRPLDLSIPPEIANDLKRIGIGSSLNHLVGVADKTDFLFRVLLVATAVKTNLTSGKKLADSQLIKSLGFGLYNYGERPALELEEEE